MTHDFPIKETVYEVREVRGDQATFWTVIATEDGVVKGGDHTWLDTSLAHKAKTAYERGDMVHRMVHSALLSELWKALEEALDLVDQHADAIRLDRLRKVLERYRGV